MNLQALSHLRAALNTNQFTKGNPIATKKAGSAAEAATHAVNITPSLSGHRTAAYAHSTAADHHAAAGNFNQEAYHRKMAEHHASAAATSDKNKNPGQKDVKATDKVKEAAAGKNKKDAKAVDKVAAGQDKKDAKTSADQKDARGATLGALIKTLSNPEGINQYSQGHVDTAIKAHLDAHNAHVSAEDAHANARMSGKNNQLSKAVRLTKDAHNATRAAIRAERVMTGGGKGTFFSEKSKAAYAQSYNATLDPRMPNQDARHANTAYSHLEAARSIKKTAQIKTAGAFPENSQRVIERGPFKVGDPVLINCPGDAAHGQVGSITKCMPEAFDVSVNGAHAGTFPPTQLRVTGSLRMASNPEGINQYTKGGGASHQAAAKAHEAAAVAHETNAPDAHAKSIAADATTLSAKYGGMKTDAMQAVMSSAEALHASETGDHREAADLHREAADFHTNHAAVLNGEATSKNQLEKLGREVGLTPVSSRYKRGLAALRDRILGGPGSGWTAAGGHVPGGHAGETFHGVDSPSRFSTIRSLPDSQVHTKGDVTRVQTASGHTHYQGPGGQASVSMTARGPMLFKEDPKSWASKKITGTGDLHQMAFDHASGKKVLGHKLKGASMSLAAIRERLLIGNGNNQYTHSLGGVTKQPHIGNSNFYVTKGEASSGRDKPVAGHATFDAAFKDAQNRAGDRNDHNVYSKDGEHLSTHGSWGDELLPAGHKFKGASASVNALRELIGNGNNQYTKNNGSLSNPKTNNPASSGGGIGPGQVAAIATGTLNQHPLIGKQVKTNDGKTGTVTHVHATRFGPLAVLDNNHKEAYATHSLKTLIGNGNNQYTHGHGGGSDSYARRSDSTVKPFVASKMPKETAWQQRSSTPTAKDAKRISDIVAKSGGNPSKAHDLAHQMANAITDPMKASRRGRAADSLGHSSIATIFHERHRRLIGRAATLGGLRDLKLKTLQRFNEGDEVIIIDNGESGTVTSADDGEYDVDDHNGNNLGTFLSSEIRAANQGALSKLRRRLLAATLEKDAKDVVTGQNVRINLPGSIYHNDVGTVDHVQGDFCRVCSGGHGSFVMGTFPKSALRVTDEVRSAGKGKVHTEKWHRCWEKVQGQGHDESSAAAICTSSIGSDESLNK